MVALQPDFLFKFNGMIKNTAFTAPSHCSVTLKRNTSDWSRNLHTLSYSAMSTPVPQVSVDSSFGVLYTCTTAAAVLWGTLCVQYYMYTRDYPEDRKFIKYIALAVFVLNTLNQILWCYTVYVLMVKGFNDPSSPKRHVWSVDAACINNAFSVILVQGFYAWRLWLLSDGSIPLVAAIGIFSLGAFIFNIILFATVLPLNNYAIFLRKPHLVSELVTLGYGFLVCDATCDVIIGGSFAYLLHKSKSGIKRSDSIVNRLMLYSIRTGLVTSTVAIGQAVLGPASNDLYSIALYPILTRLYANSMIAVLNSRQALRRDAHGPPVLSTSSGEWGGNSDVKFGNVTNISRQTGVSSIPSTRGDDDTHRQHIPIHILGDSTSADYDASNIEGDISMKSMRSDKC
ncbi:hypothetical protein BD410DRAFT_160014 [Rickenella mellea]|uniref:DUF6534 domain-containing protein n=1 Tax=Rickenella mellea TaxID=50990 RepID=A0A4Y7Q897_9AGAM|nr:hypothetical protein BD410DRAFT_160014 [Rickenella mellea]